MADVRPSSAPLFTTTDNLWAELTEDVDVNSITMSRGANEFIGNQASHHDGVSTLGPRGNRVQDGRFPRAKSASVTTPSRANPLGSERSLNG